MERVLPSDGVKAKVSDLTVGLASDCDSPEGAVEKLMREHLPDASTLPFVGLVAHDGTWVAGFSGYKDAAAFLAVLEEAGRAPILQASPAVQKKIAGLAAKAAKAAGKGDWKSVLKAGGEVTRMYGRCAERESVVGFVRQARAWAAAKFDEVERACRSGGDLAQARKLLGEVRKQFAGEPEIDDVNAGLKAVQRLSTVLSIESRGTVRPDLREKAAEDFQGTRWARVFESGDAPGAADEDEEEGDDSSEGTEIEEGSSG